MGWPVNNTSAQPMMCVKGQFFFSLPISSGGGSSAATLGGVVVDGLRNEQKKEGPDGGVIDPTADHPRCPKATTRDLEGSLGVSFFTALSMTPGGDTVPFYFQPTIGGADINGNASLSSYQDYRFRAHPMSCCFARVLNIQFGSGFSVPGRPGKSSVDAGRSRIQSLEAQLFNGA